MKQSSSSEEGMKIITIDLETTMADICAKRSASNPYCEDNRIVAFGAKMVGSEAVCTYHPPGDDIVFNDGPRGEKGFMLVGHNIKFDLTHMRPRFTNTAEFNKWIDAARIWDTQIAEYIISGQTEKFASLDDTAERRGLGKKIEMDFEMPEGAAKYDEATLVAYLETDLQLTESVALQQMQECTDEQFQLIVQMGDALKAVADMEFNGMHVDEDILIDKLALVGIRQAEVEEALSEHICNPDLVEAKPEWYNSSQILSCIIFGGTVHYQKKEPNGLWKSGAKKGQVRYKNTDMKQEFGGFVVPKNVDAKAGKKKTKSGEPIYSVDEDTLDVIQKSVIMSAGDHDMIRDIIEMRALKKVAGTYYENLLEMEIEGIVHHSLNQCATSTGRLSSSSPNLQNVPMAGDEPLLNVKSCFTSRYGEDGLMLEVDFKQLEVCALAWLTKDPQLIHDIQTGKDIHSEIANAVGLDATDKRIRRDVKTIVFAMMYGSGSKGIAKSSGLDETLVKKVINSFYTRYSTIKGFYDDLNETIAKSPRYDIVKRNKDGSPTNVFEWTSPTGRKYIFDEDQFRAGTPAYTQVRNYPVQGTATGDIVPVVLGEIAEVLRNARKGLSQNVALVTTTHDSATFDCKNYDTLKALIWKLEADIFSNLNAVINERLPSVEWGIPLVVEYECGPDWGNMKTLDKTSL